MTNSATVRSARPASTRVELRCVNLAGPSRHAALHQGGSRYLGMTHAAERAERMGLMARQDPEPRIRAAGNWSSDRMAAATSTRSRFMRTQRPALTRRDLTAPAFVVEPRAIKEVRHGTRVTQVAPTRSASRLAGVGSSSRHQACPHGRPVGHTGAMMIRRREQTLGHPTANGTRTSERDHRRRPASPLHWRRFSSARDQLRRTAAEC